MENEKRFVFCGIEHLMRTTAVLLSFIMCSFSKFFQNDLDISEHSTILDDFEEN